MAREVDRVAVLAALGREEAEHQLGAGAAAEHQGRQVGEEEGAVRALPVEVPLLQEEEPARAQGAGLRDDGLHQSRPRKLAASFIEPAWVGM